MSRKSYRQAIHEALRQEMRRDPRVVLLGEDIAGGAGAPGEDDAWGGVMGVTKGLVGEFGRDRVLDTPLSESAFIGAAAGAAATGLRPVVELMFVDFMGVCLDQIFNQAAKFRYMFGGGAVTPMVIRTTYGAGLRAASQHSQCLYPLFTHIPGLKVVIPSSPYEAKGLLIQAIRDDDPVIVFENKMMYDLEEEVPDEPYTIPFGEANLTREGDDVTIVAIGRMVPIANQAADRLAKQGISCTVLDPRTTSPLDVDTILECVEETGRLVIVDEASPRCNLATDISALVAQEAFDALRADPHGLPAARPGALCGQPGGPLRAECGEGGGRRAPDRATPGEGARLTMPDITPITLPKFGLAMTEGKIVSWAKPEGSEIAVGEELVDIETSKITNAYESPVKGVLRRHVGSEQEELPIGALIAVVADASVPESEINAFIAKFQAEFAGSRNRARSETAVAPIRVEVGGRAIRYLETGAARGPSRGADPRFWRRPEQLAVHPARPRRDPQGDRARPAGAWRIEQGRRSRGPCHVLQGTRRFPGRARHPHGASRRPLARRRGRPADGAGASGTRRLPQPDLPRRDGRGDRCRFHAGLHRRWTSQADAAGLGKAVRGQEPGPQRDGGRYAQVQTARRCASGVDGDRHGELRQRTPKRGLGRAVRRARQSACGRDLGRRGPDHSGPARRRLAQERQDPRAARRGAHAAPGEGGRGQPVIARPHSEMNDLQMTTSP